MVKEDRYKAAIVAHSDVAAKIIELATEKLFKGSPNIAAAYGFNGVELKRLETFIKASKVIQNEKQSEQQ